MATLNSLAARIMERLLKLLVSICYFIAQGIVVWLLHVFSLKKGRATCVILCYHGILDEHRQRFARHMDILKKWVSVIDIEKSLVLKDDTSHVGITFDDGLMSFGRNAFPELANRHIPSTIFVPTGYLGSKCTWMRSAEVYMREEGKLPPSRDLLQLENDRVMRKEEISALDERLVVVGSHGITHTNMDVMSEEDAKNELSVSKSTLEKIVGRPVRLISFPRGKFNRMLVESCKEVGYWRSFSITPRRAFAAPDEYVVGRVVAEPTDWDIEFWLKIKGAYSWLGLVTKLRNMVKGCSSGLIWIV